MARWVAAAALALAGGAPLTGCAGHHPAPADPAAMNRPATVRNPQAAQATAQTEMGLLAGGDYGGAWDLWDAPAKATVDRARFVAYGTTCRPGLGQAVRVTATRRVDDDTYAMDWAGGTLDVHWTGGSWRVSPGAGDLTRYASATCPRGG